MLKITIITSDEDIASKTIRKHILSKYDFQEQPKSDEWNSEYIQKIYSYSPEITHGTLKFTLIVINLRMIYLDKYFSKEDLKGDLIIFASRHRSESEKQALLCHTPGNWTDNNQFGGFKAEIAKGSGILLFYLYKFMRQKVKEKELQIAVDQEITHHGPTNFTQPLAFIELGSNTEGWKNEEGGEIIAETIIETGIVLARDHYADNQLHPNGINICVGFGGTHYMANFTRLNARNCGFVHTIPKYHMDLINADIIEQIREKSLEPIDHWVVDWKGLNSLQKEKLFKILNEMGIQYIKRKDLEKEKLL